MFSECQCSSKVAEIDHTVTVPVCCAGAGDTEVSKDMAVCGSPHEESDMCP